MYSLNTFSLFKQERLPPHASIEWITSIFSEYGVVAYVSLPKFKDATRIKGFAFVEFCDPESAAKAVTVSFLSYLVSNTKTMRAHSKIV